MSIISDVIQQIRLILNDESEFIQENTALLTLSSFDSLSIVQLLEKLEEQFAIEIEPALILPETFATPRSIADVITTSLERLNNAISQ